MLTESLLQIQIVDKRLNDLKAVLLWKSLEHLEAK